MFDNREDLGEVTAGEGQVFVGEFLRLCLLSGLALLGRGCLLLRLRNQLRDVVIQEEIFAVGDLNSELQADVSQGS